MPLSAPDNEQAPASLQEIQRSVAIVWFLNLVPFLGLGFLYAARLRGLPFLFFLWLAEIAVFKGSAIVPEYFLLSMLGTFIVVIEKRKMTLDEMLRPLQDEPLTTGDTNAERECAIAGAIARKEQLMSDATIDLDSDHSDFALSSFDRKLHAAEKQLAARSAEDGDAEDDDADDLDADADAKAGAKGELSQNLSAAQSKTPTASGLSVSNSVDVFSPAQQAENRHSQKVVAAADQTAFAAVQADTMGDAARFADQLTATFAAENAGAAAGFLDTSAQADAASVIQLESSPVKVNTSVPTADHSQIDVPSSGVTPIPGLGEIPALGLHGFESTLGVVPTLPSLSGEPLSGLSSSTNGFGQQSESGAATTGGAAAAQSPKCPKCGADLHGQFSFCLSCLSPL